jgi:hypothetical protein
MRSILFALALLMPASNAYASLAPANQAEAVVLKDFEALSRGDADALASVFAGEIEMYRLPNEDHSLTGPRNETLRTREQLHAFFKRAFTERPPWKHEVVQMLSLGEWVIVRVAMHAPDGTPPDHAFTAFRVQDGLIDAIWHVAREKDAAADSGDAARAVVERREAAANRADADGFLAVFHPDARHFHHRGDPARFGGGPSKRVTDQASRERYTREWMAEAPGHVALLQSVALGEWVAFRTRHTAADGAVTEAITLDRVRDGRVIGHWYVAENKLQP